ncbi:hypothetical protein BWZ22_03645 [Seonamhaeicola sp. S2-3]|uniref:hypothetical protein n=1 Tax=Seonamhaeicola sp. S2-3 TaxID=1936081 RepID=UPI000972C42A|nr:hypothetical protein [Seonamhaeicola sp. S2-3]APY10387.1 hypothetical protein BWZ22_03645 [Seonamhaeicola sp. S2-3]
MKAKFFSVIITCFIISSAYSQTNLNEYKYVIVPNKFDFLREKDQYQMNSLAEFLFEKYGFNAIIEGEEYPDDLTKNRCLALRSDVLKDKGMFKTKLQVELKDCNDRVVYTSPTGESREKEYGKAYNEALRNAFKPFEAMHYSYKPKENVTAITTNENGSQQPVANNKVSKEIEALKAEIENLKKEKEVKPQPTTVITTNQKINEVKTQVKEEIAVAGVLYAQEIANGFQLVDSSPKVVYRMKNTGLDNVFLVEGKSAIIFKKGNNWVIEYYLGNQLKQDVLNIKF